MKTETDRENKKSDQTFLSITNWYQPNTKNISYKNCLPELKPKGVVNLFGITEVEQTYKYLDKTKFFSLSLFISAIFLEAFL